MFVEFLLITVPQMALVGNKAIIINNIILFLQFIFKQHKPNDWREPQKFANGCFVP